jgi:arylsulfatase A-like enzyme
MRNLRNYSKVIFIVGGYLLLQACNTSEKKLESIYPNIVYILADDMGYGDVSGLNPESKIPTPNMDRLIDEGMYFSDAHSPSAVCTPTRYGVLTGRYCFRTRLESGVLVGHEPSLIEPGRVTVASMLQEKGYNTACIGKWHLGLDFKKKDPGKPLVEGNLWELANTSNVDYAGEVNGGPADCGFNYSFILPSSLDIQPYIYIRNRKVVNPDIIHVEGVGGDDFQGKFWRPGDASRDFDFEQTLPLFTEEAVKFISDHAEQQPEDPFFLYLPLPAPHTPWMPLKEFVGKSEAGRYGDFVSQVDYTVGEVLKILDEKALADNTIVFLTSDNGAYWFPYNIDEFDHRSNYLFSGMKSDVWEGGHHIPLVARWPGKIESGSTSDQLVSLTDLLATCADIVDYVLPYNSGEDSYSHLHAMTGTENDQIRDQLVMQSVSGMYAIRKNNWKLILGKGSGGWTYEGTPTEPEGQLYDLSIDIEEKNNVYLDHPKRVESMTGMLKMFQAEQRSR